MQHIEETLLHEYLDRRGESDPALARVSEHLSGCAECRARLKAADELRSGADGILRAASPLRVKAPAFEAVVAAANARAAGAGVVAPASVTAPRRSSWNDTRRMAWAATIVLALGAGWIGNSLYRDARRAEVVTPTVTDAAANKVPAGQGPDIAASADAAASVATAPPVGQATDAAAPRTSESRSLAASGTGAQSDAPSSARVAQADARAEKTALAESAPPPSALERPTNAMAQVDVTTGGIAARFRPDSVRAVELDAIQTRGARNPLVPRDQVSSRSIVTGEVMDKVSTEASIVRPGTWTTVRGDEALRKSGGEIVRIAGLETVDYAISVDQFDTRIRVRQRTVRGDTIAVVQVPATAPGKLASNSSEPVSTGRGFAAEPPPVAATFEKETSGYLNGEAYQVGRLNGSRRIAITARNAALLENLKTEIARTW